MITYSRLGLNGRFGNQLFQFSGTIGIADKNNYKVSFPINVNNQIQSLSNGVTFTAKVDILDCFDIDSKYFSDVNRTDYDNKSERFFHFDESLFNVENNTNIDGYLQSEKYFEHCRDKILDTLKFKENILNDSLNLIPKTSKKLVSVHVRRKDYLTIPEVHPFVGTDYLSKAMSEFNLNEHHFVICSDDYDWCNERWGNDKNCTVIKSPSHFIDFCILSMCDDHIISNSSFSWWSSYLSKSKDKRVIAPSIWFGPRYANYNTNDIYRKEMKRL